MDDIRYDIRECLLDQDGSCRDVNFESPTWPGVFCLVSQLEAQFARVSLGTSTVAEFHDATSTVANIQGDGGHAQLLFRDGTGVLTELQLFVSVEENGDPFVELTFFPQDVMPIQSLSDAFVIWVRSVREALCSRRAFARYENMSWKFGDINAEVFLVSGG